jgi:hypothetical protein
MVETEEEKDTRLLTAVQKVPEVVLGTKRWLSSGTRIYELCSLARPTGGIVLAVIC